MPMSWRKKIARLAAGLGVMGLVGTGTFAFRHASPIAHLLPLVPVAAPLVPARAGERFAPGDAPSVPLPLEGKDGEMPPQSTGTHVTAILRRAHGARLVAVWGDPVLWEHTRKSSRPGPGWQPAPGLPALTGEAQEVIALGEEKGHIVVGTRRAGLFVADKETWKPLPRANAPYNADAQALCAYRGVLFAATLNDGLVVRDNHAVWQHLAPPRISTVAPRQFVVWHDVLYVRHGNGMVDTFDGRNWTRNVFARLPRAQVFALATDGPSLFLAQWGGWSQTSDGKTWASHFPDDLKNVPTTTLLPTRNALYVGTQGRGLAECDLGTGAVRKWHDERGGINDDWITALAPSPQGIVAGTFVSGAFRANEKPDTDTALWKPLDPAQKDCVTGASATPQATYVCLRRGGVWRIGGEGGWESVSPLKEAQCVWPDAANHLLWVGTRTGIYTVAEPAPQP